YDWVYRDPESKKDYTVKFNVAVKVYNPCETSGQNMTVDKTRQDPSANLVEVTATEEEMNKYSLEGWGRSYVSADRRGGQWLGYTFMYRVFGSAAPHEFGHLLFLGDRYKDIKDSSGKTTESE